MSKAKLLGIKEAQGTFEGKPIIPLSFTFPNRL